MQKYKQNTDQSLDADNSIRFPGMTELTDSEVEKQIKTTTTSSSMFSWEKKKGVKRALEDQSALAFFSAMSVMIWCNIKVPPKKTQI